MPFVSEDSQSIPERIPGDLFELFAENPTRYCATLQAAIMTSRLEGWRAVAQAPRLAFDRTVSEDLEVFCRLHQSSGYLSVRNSKGFDS